MSELVWLVWGIVIGAQIGAALVEYLRKPVVHYHVDTGHFNVMPGASIQTNSASHE